MITHGNLGRGCREEYEWGQSFCSFHSFCLVCLGVRFAGEKSVKMALILEGRSIFVYVTYSHAAGGLAHCGGERAVAHFGGQSVVAHRGGETFL